MDDCGGVSGPTAPVLDSGPKSTNNVQLLNTIVAGSLSLGNASANGLIQQLPASEQLDLHFTEIRAFVHTVLPESKRQKYGKLQEKQILNGITGTVHPGEVLAVMGPSGSGKTSLLTILGTRMPRQVRVQGSITFNGEPVTKAVKRKVAFVTQDDMLYANLTVYETLYYAAMLRLRQSMGKPATLERVEEVLHVLGLTKVRNTIIGGPNRRGVSGGERKRVSVGHELLTNPSVLLLDEATSGLDSTTAMSLVTLLNQLARAGRTVATTIHQPSSQLYRKLDKTMLLADGCVMYYGPSARAAGWFEEQGVVCPFGVNVADFLLDLASGDLSQAQGGFSGSKEDLIHSYDTKLAVSSRTTFVALPSSQYQPTPTSEYDPACCAFFTNQKWGATYFQQLNLLFWRTLRSQRFQQVNVDRLVQLVLIASVAGIYWWRTGAKMTVQGAIDVTGLQFFTVIFMAMVTMLGQIFTFPEARNMMVKERRSGMYRLSAYYIARTLADMPLECSLPVLYVTIIYWMGGLRPTIWAFLSNLAITLLVLTAASATGQFIGALTMNTKRGQTAGFVTLLFLLLVSGYYVKNVPSWLQWVEWVSFVAHGYRGILFVEFKGRTYYNCGDLRQVKDPSGDPRCSEVQDLQSALNLPFDPLEEPYKQLGLLCLISFVMRIACYVALRVRTSK